MKKPLPGFWYCEIWKMNFWFFINWPVEEFEAWVQEHDKHFKVRRGVGAHTLLLENDDGQRIFVWTRPQPHAKMLAAICHEAVHASHWCLDIRGFKSDFNNDEPEAYLAEKIFSEALRHKRKL